MQRDILREMLELGGWLNFITFKFTLKLLIPFPGGRKNREKTWTHHLSLPPPNPIPHIFSIVYGRVHLEDPRVCGGSAELTCGLRLQKRWKTASTPIVRKGGVKMVITDLGLKSRSDLVSELSSGDRNRVS